MRTLATTLFAILAVLSCAQRANAIKFELIASPYPEEMCIWNAAHGGDLIIVTANVGPGNDQRVDVEIKEREGGNVYLNKKNIRGETRLAVTAHREDDVGVCFKNTLEQCESRLFFSRNYCLNVSQQLLLGPEWSTSV